MINIERYNELATIQQETLLSFNEQEEMIKISTDILNNMLTTNQTIKDILIRLRDR